MPIAQEEDYAQRSSHQDERGECGAQMALCFSLVVASMGGRQQVHQAVRQPQIKKRRPCHHCRDGRPQAISFLAQVGENQRDADQPEQRAENANDHAGSSCQGDPPVALERAAALCGSLERLQPEQTGQFPESFPEKDGQRRGRWAANRGIRWLFRRLLHESTSERYRVLGAKSRRHIGWR